MEKIPKNSSRSPEESKNPEINADSGNWTSSELPEMNKMVQLQFPRRLRLLNCFTVGRLHSYMASAQKWNEQRCTTDNWMKCKCKHFHMKQIDNHSKNQMHKMTTSCKTVQIFASHSTSFQAGQHTFSANSRQKSAQIENRWTSNSKGIILLSPLQP